MSISGNNSLVRSLQDRNDSGKKKKSNRRAGKDLSHLPSAVVLEVS